MKYKTESGVTITAENRAAADAIAQDMGIGIIVEEIKEVVMDGVVRKGLFAVSKNSSIVYEGSLAAAAEFSYDNGGKILFSDGSGLNKKEQALVKAWIDDAE